MYSATGIDNSGLYAGRREAIGIIKAMAGEITSFDVFSGIGISAATAFAKAAKSSYDFEKEFRKNMLEVATISTQVTDDMTGFMNQVMSITQEIPVTAPEAAKALYQIVSAGHDGADGMKVLEVAARSAVGGMTDTATAADAITTLLNAYKLSAEDADKVSDQLFTTARLGKTTFGELGQSISQVAPIAAAYGVEMDQVLAAVATLTKSGVPTAQAMTQIRASIIAVSKELGDGAFNSMTFQEALAEVANRAGGSESKLRELIPEVEAVNGVLGMTGIKAQDAASHLAEMNASAGATETAFKQMMEDVDKQMILLSNNIQAALRPMGQAILKEVYEVATAFNEALENGEAKEAMKSLGGLIVIVTGAFIGYKGSVIATTAAKNAYTKALAISRLASIQQITTTQLLTNSIKAQTAAMLRNIVALATNPYVLAAAAIAALGYGIYRYATQATAAEKAMAAHNKRVNDLKALADDTIKSAEGLLSSLRDENVLMTERVGIYEKLKGLYPGVLDNISLENFLLMDSVEANNLLAKSLDERIKTQQKADVNTIEAEMKANNAKILGLESKKSKNEDSGDKSIFGELTLGESFELDKLKKRNEQLQIEFDKARAIVVQGLKDETAAQKVTASLDLDNESGKTVLERKIQLTKDLAEANANLNKLRAPSSTAKNSEIEAAEDKVKEIKGKLEALTGSAMKDANTLHSEQSDRLRAIEDYRKSISDAEVQAELDIRQQRIDTMDEGSKKELAMIQLNYDRLRDVNRKRADDMIKERQELERKQWEYDNPEWKEKGMTFKPSTTSVQQLSKPQQGMLLAFDKQTLAARKKAEDDYQKTLMEKYQDYTDKRLAIEKRYNDDLAVLRSERRKAEASGDTGKVEKLDRAIAQGTKDKGKDLMGLDYDQLKESPEYVRAFENLKRTSSETLGSLLSQLENAKRTAAQVLSPDQLREYTTTIQEIMDELDSRNPFQALTDKKEELAAAERGLAEAQAALGKARSDAEAVKGGAKVQSGVRITGFDKNTKQVTSEKEYLSEAQALEKVKTATVNYNKAKDNVTDKNDKVKKSEKEVADQINGLCDSIKGVGEAIGGPAGEIITLIGDIGTFTMTAMSGVKVAADTSAQAISTVEKASVILAVISAAIQVATKIASLFGPRDQEQFDRMRERYESLVKVWDRLIDKKMEYISINTDKEAVKAGEEALDILRKQEAATRKLALARLEVRNGGHSIEYRQWAGSYKFDGRNWKDVAGEIEERTGKAFKSMRDLVDMSAEDLEWIMGSYSGFWSSLDDDFREYLERVMDYKAQAEDIDKTVGEAVTRTSFDGMRDNFLDSLLDMDSSAEDFADNVEKYMRQAILNGMVSKKYEAQLQEWYKGWVEKSADGLTGMEYDELRGAYNDMTRDALRERDNLKEMFGWESEIKDGVSGQLQAAMTEGTASQLVGLWNSTAIDMRELKQLGMEQRDSVRSIMSDVTDILRQNMLIEQNTRRGADNTDGLIGELQGGFRSLDRRLENIERNTKTSYSRG